MSRGDYTDVIYRTGAGVEKHRVEAWAVGSAVDVRIPDRPADLFVEIRVVDRKGEPLLRTQFNKNDVVGLVSGHKAFKSSKPRARKAAES